VKDNQLHVKLYFHAIIKSLEIEIIPKDKQKIEEENSRQRANLMKLVRTNEKSN
jgi:hypothetical protein